MRLRNHFRQRVGAQRPWNAVHQAWAAALASSINRLLPAGFFAAPNVHFGIEIDVAAGEDSRRLITDVVEVGVYATEGKATLAGAVEIITPANKDPQAQREAFVAKCRAYLEAGVGLVLVDIVTDRQGNLHNELMVAVGALSPTGARSSANLYAAAYHPLELGNPAKLEVSFDVLRLRENLPVQPLWLGHHLCMWLDLRNTYHQAWRETRVR